MLEAGIGAGERPLVSVVVLCYNVERYLDKCLKSIRLQTFRDYECVIVDDGSTDGSPAIYRSYVSGDCRFRVIRQPNGGLTAARKTGFNAARGTWCVSVDGDDWIGTDMLEKMTAALAAGADFVQCRTLLHLKSTAIRARFPKKAPRQGETRFCLIGDLTDEDWLEVSLCRSLLKTERLCWIYNQIDDGLIFCEDGVTLAIYAANSQSVVMLGDDLCHYRLRRSASTSTPSLRTLDMIYGIYAFMVESLRGTLHGPVLLPRYSAYVLRHCVSTILLNALYLDADERDRYVSKAMGDSRFRQLIAAAGSYLSRPSSERWTAWVKAGHISAADIERERAFRESGDMFE